MVYGEYILTVENGTWFAWLRGSLVDSGSKAYIFSILG